MLLKQNRAELVKTFGKNKAKQITAIIQQLVKAPTPETIKEYTAFVVDATADKLETEATLKEMYAAETITRAQLKNALASPDGGAAMAGAELTRRQSNIKSTNVQESEVSTKQNEDSDLLKELKKRINFTTTETKAATPAPVEDTLIAAFRDASTKASFSLLDGFVQANQRWHNGGKN